MLPAHATASLTQSLVSGLKRARERLANPWTLASAVGLLALLSCVAVFGRDAGVIWDDSLHLEYGNRVLAWFRSGFRDRSAMSFLDLYLYGGLFDAPAQWLTQFSPFGPYETRHSLSGLLGLLGVVASWKIGARLGGARAGFLAAAMLVLTPAWTGHALFNPKDIPFGAAAAFVALACVRIAIGEAPLTWAAALQAGLCVGLAVAVRPGGMFLFGYPVLAAVGNAALWALARRRHGEPMRIPHLGGMVALRLAAAFALAWLLMLSAWPWAQLAPLSRPFEAAREAAQFAWNGDVLFNGHVFTPKQLPRSYLFVWFGITLPEIYLVALALGVVALAMSWRSRARNPPRTLALAVLLLHVLLPLAGVLIRRPVIYDGQRHFLFLLPPLAALAGIALSEFFELKRPPHARAAGAVLLCAVAALTAVDMIRLHPYEYTYFNRLFGGLPAAAGRFETDYWGASYKEGFSWLVDNVNPDSPRPLRVASCGAEAQIEYYLGRWPSVAKRFAFVEDKNQADFLVATTRYGCHKTAGEIIHILERQGVPLLYVIRLHPTQPPRPERHPKRHHARRVEIGGSGAASFAR